MTKELIGGLAIALVATIAIFIYLSNRKTRSRQELELAAPIAFEGEGTKLFYVSTVFTEKPLDRVWAHGLGIRGNAQIAFAESGIGISRTGESGFWIPKEALSSFNLQSATIDKGVEKDGLIAINWRLGSRAVTSVLRVTVEQSRRQVIFELEKLIGVAVG